MRTNARQAFWLTAALAVAIFAPSGASGAGASGRAAVADQERRESAKSASPADEESDPIRAVAGAIAVEARDHWKAENGWSRSKATYASDHPEALTSEHALAGLQRKLFKHPALDGYVKRQLLGYVSDGDLANADRGAMVKSLRLLPQVIDQPQPRVRRGSAGGGASVTGSGDGAFIYIGRETSFISGFTPIVNDGNVVLRPKVDVLRTGTLLSTDGVVTVGRNVMLNVEAATSELIRLRRLTSEANEPILGLREALAERIDDPPLRLALMLDDAAKRMHAGHPSYERAIERFVETTAAYRRSRAVPADTRRRLINHLQKLADYEKKRIRDLEVLNERQFKVEHTTIAWPPEMMQRAVLNLRGKTPPGVDGD